MDKKILKNFNSVRYFKTELEETHTFIHALKAQIWTTEIFFKFTNANANPKYQKFKKYLEINERQIKKLYELGFIAFFANFECFMFEFLKELHKKYPSSFLSEKIIKFEDIKDFKKTIDIKNYFIDSLAIEKSYDIETWVNFLNQKFGIVIFKNKKDLSRFKALNSLRNIILHSGGKTNVKFRKEMKTFIKTPVPIGKKFKLDPRKYFGILYGTLKILIENIEKT